MFAQFSEVLTDESAARCNDAQLRAFISMLHLMLEASTVMTQSPQASEQCQRNALCGKHANDNKLMQAITNQS